MRNKILGLIILLVFLGIECINFSINYGVESFESLRSRFWLFHMFASIIYIFLSTYILKADLGYYDLIIFFLPLLGGIILLCESIFSLFKREMKNSIEEAYDMEKYVKVSEEDEMELQKELNTIAAYDSLTVKTTEEKKRFIFEFNPPNIDFKIEVLEKALRDEDINVIHYAAVELNRIDMEFQKNIKEAEKKGDNLEIYRAYKGYIDSGILKDFMLDFYLEKSLNLLLNLFQVNKKLRDELLVIYEKMEKKLEYENLLKELIEESSEKIYIEKLLEFLYRENRYEELLEYYEKYKNLGIYIPEFLMDGEVKR